MGDLVSRDAVIEILAAMQGRCDTKAALVQNSKIWQQVKDLPSVQPTLYGYNIEHLELIARVLQKEDLPPERIVEVLTDIGRIVAIVKDDFEEALRKAAEQCMI